MFVELVLHAIGDRGENDRMISLLRFHRTSAFHILLEPLLPLLRCPSGTYTPIFDAVEEDSRGNMHTSHPVGLHHLFDVVCDRISDIQTPIFARLIADPQQLEDLLLVNTFDLPRQARKPFVCLIPRLMHHVDVEILLLVLEEEVGECPELRWSSPEDSSARLMSKGRGRVPWLDLLAEDDADTRLGVFLLDEGPDGMLDCLEHLC